MQERKAMMSALSEAFIALPGGFGTLNELLEVVTATQLKLTAKPCGLLNTAGYYDPLVVFLRHASLEAFIHREELSILSIAEDPDDLISLLTSSRMALGGLWGRYNSADTQPRRHLRGQGRKYLHNATSPLLSIKHYIGLALWDPRDCHSRIGGDYG
jgi:hypothetical protein